MACPVVSCCRLVLLAADLDLDGLWLDVLGLWNGDHQDAVLVGCLDLARVDVARQAKLTSEVGRRELLPDRPPALLGQRLLTPRELVAAGKAEISRLVSRERAARKQAEQENARLREELKRLRKR